MEGYNMSFENHQTGTRDLIADLRKQLAEKDKRIAELESWLKPFHGDADDVNGYEIYELNPKTESGLPMIPAESEKK